jgi:acetyl-CoA acyltransferase
VGLLAQQLDEFALRLAREGGGGHRRGRFAGQIAPVTTAEGVVDTDEGVRRGGTLEKLARSSRPSRRTARSRRPTARRSPTARPPCWS